MLFILLLQFWVAPAFSQVPELVVYTYDSMLAPGGLGPIWASGFEKKENCRIKMIGVGDGAQFLSRLALDAKRGKHPAQLVLGLDQSLWHQIKPFAESWGGWRPKGYSQLRAESLVEPGFLPFDYGVGAFMVNRTLASQNSHPLPVALADLSQWPRQFILEDPRTSIPGLVFLLYTKAVFGSSFGDFWKKLRGQWLTLMPSWSGAYQLFLKQEAPLVWSYVSSQAFHQSESPYRAVLFNEGQPLQIEGAILVKNSTETLTQKTQRALAKAFLEYMISEEAQKEIPQKVWMMPARQNVALPSSFKNLPQPKKIIKIQTNASEIEATLAEWGRTLWN